MIQANTWICKCGAELEMSSKSKHLASGCNTVQTLCGVCFEWEKNIYNHRCRVKLERTSTCIKCKAEMKMKKKNEQWETWVCECGTKMMIGPTYEKGKAKGCIKNRTSCHYCGDEFNAKSEHITKGCPQKIKDQIKKQIEKKIFVINKIKKSIASTINEMTIHSQLQVNDNKMTESSHLIPQSAIEIANNVTNILNKYNKKYTNEKSNNNYTVSFGKMWEHFKGLSDLNKELILAKKKLKKLEEEATACNDYYRGHFAYNSDYMKNKLLQQNHYLWNTQLHQLMFPYERSGHEKMSQPWNFGYEISDKIDENAQETIDKVFGNEYNKFYTIEEINKLFEEGKNAEDLIGDEDTEEHTRRKVIGKTVQTHHDFMTEDMHKRLGTEPEDFDMNDKEWSFRRQVNRFNTDSTEHEQKIEWIIDSKGLLGRKRKLLTALPIARDNEDKWVKELKVVDSYLKYYDQEWNKLFTKKTQFTNNENQLQVAQDNYKPREYTPNPDSCMPHVIYANPMTQYGLEIKEYHVETRKFPTKNVLLPKRYFHRPGIASGVMYIDTQMRPQSICQSETITTSQKSVEAKDFLSSDRTLQETSCGSEKTGSDMVSFPNIMRTDIEMEELNTCIINLEKKLKIVREKQAILASKKIWDTITAPHSAKNCGVTVNILQ